MDVVLPDTQVYVDLEREGLARDFVRLVQRTRKDAGFEVTDRIRLAAHVPDRMACEAVKGHGDHICRETVAIDLRLNEHIAGSYQTRHKLSRSEVTIEVARV